MSATIIYVNDGPICKNIIERMAYKMAQVPQELKIRDTYWQTVEYLSNPFIITLHPDNMKFIGSDDDNKEYPFVSRTEVYDDRLCRCNSYKLKIIEPHWLEDEAKIMADFNSPGKIDFLILSKRLSYPDPIRFIVSLDFPKYLDLFDMIKIDDSCNPCEPEYIEFEICVDNPIYEDSGKLLYLYQSKKDPFYIGHYYK